MNGNYVHSAKKILSSNSLNTGASIEAKKPRSSNLELYRILCMVMIVSHHYVVNSGLKGGPLITDFTSSNSFFLTIFGAWGKTGINCFIMITGYFMCTSTITFKKFLKLMGQIYFYRWLLFVVFLVSGYETLTPKRIIQIVMPFWGLSDGFVPCFIIFWLTIPFLNILVKNMNERQHQVLLLLTLGVYTIFGSLPTFAITFNYITWFIIIYFIASYIRLYPRPIFEKKHLWSWMSLLSFLLASLSICALRALFGERVEMGYNFVEDCNKIFAVSLAVCSFLWFKNLNIKYSKIINAFGAGTFGVLLIHANSNAMRTWLWKDTIDCVGHYHAMATVELALYCCSVVLLIFIICNLIDQLRIATLEKYFFRWYDRTFAAKVDMWINKIIRNN